MTKLKILAATALATSLIAAPAMAAPDKAPAHKTMKVQKTMKHARAHVRSDRAADASYQRGFNSGYDRAQAQNDFRAGYGRSTTTYYDGGFADNGYATRGYDSGFWPADVAADAVTGPVGAAGAIATAPFRDTYAYDNGYTAAPVYRSNVVDGSYNSAWDNDWNANWARRQSVQEGGFVCTPGSYYTNSYGYTQLCQ